LESKRLPGRARRRERLPPASASEVGYRLRRPNRKDLLELRPQDRRPQTALLKTDRRGAQRYEQWSCVGLIQSRFTVLIRDAFFVDSPADI